MVVSLKHSKTSAVADSGDTTLVQPSDWNAEHVLTQATGALLGRTTAGGGATEEISVSSELTLSTGTLGVASTLGAKVIDVNSSGDALRITQIGSGNALVVEDSANPDSTPFVVTADGRVGIGVTAPTTQLNVYAASAASLLVQSEANSTVISQRSSDNTAAGTTVLRKSRGTVASPTAVNSADFVGSFNYQAYGGTNYRNIAQVIAAVDTYTSDTNISGYLTFSTNGGSTAATERMRITAAGDLLVGTTTNPNTSKLHLSAGGNSRMLQLTGTDVDSSAGVGLTNDAVAWNFSLRGDSSDSLIFRNITAGVDAVTFTTGGNVGIGVSPSTRLHVAGDTATEVRVVSSGNLTSGGSSFIRFGGSNSATSGYVGFGGTASQLDVWNTLNGAMTFATNNLERMRITAGGEVNIAGTTDQGAYNLQVAGTGVWGAGAYVNGSDARLKEDIADLPSATDIVAALRPVTFRYKAEYSRDTSIQPGFIAQELQAALAGTDYVDGVVQTGPEHLNVAYQALIPVLTKALQEANAKITALEARVAALEGSA